MNSRTHEFSWKLLLRQADASFRDGNLDETEELYKQALSQVEDELGPNNPHTRHILIKLADCYEEQGRTFDSHELYRRVHAMVTAANPMLV
ncbi:MAG TPA: tetratricopeptide repeat protein [Candidatus Obscuribacterales bacterium]